MESFVLCLVKMTQDQVVIHDSNYRVNQGLGRGAWKWWQTQMAFSLCINLTVKCLWLI